MGCLKAFSVLELQNKSLDLCQQPSFVQIDSQQAQAARQQSYVRTTCFAELLNLSFIHNKISISLANLLVNYKCPTLEDRPMWTLEDKKNFLYLRV